MSLLSKLKTLDAVTNTAGRTPMTEKQVVALKARIRTENRGYNVHPNTFDVSVPYRVALNYDKVWHNYGNFTSVDVAAAVGSIVSAAFFGEKAKAGVFDATKVEAHEEFIAWMADPRNVEVIAQAGGEESPF